MMNDSKQINVLSVLVNDVSAIKLIFVCTMSVIHDRLMSGLCGVTRLCKILKRMCGWHSPKGPCVGLS